MAGVTKVSFSTAEIIILTLFSIGETKVTFSPIFKITGYDVIGSVMTIGILLS